MVQSSGVEFAILQIHKNIYSHIPWHHPLIPPEKPKKKAVPFLGEEVWCGARSGWFVLISANTNKDGMHEFCIPSCLSLLEYITSEPPPQKVISLPELIIWAINGRKATSGFQHSVWHQWIGDDVSFPGNLLAFCPFLSSPLTLRAEANNAGTQPAVTAASITHRAAAAAPAAASRGCFSCQIPAGISQGRYTSQNQQEQRTSSDVQREGPSRSNEYLPTFW